MANAKKQSAALPVLEGEDPWTQEEIDEVTAELEADRQRLEKTLSDQQADLDLLMREGNDRTGRDPADVGSSNFERDQELSVHHSQRDMLAQTIQALRALDDGTYGYCENCGNPIGKLRLEAYPRATTCVQCKKRQERR